MKDQKLTVRVLSLALVVCMLVGMLPLSVFAAENTASGDFTKEEAPQYLLFAGNRSGVATAIGTVIYNVAAGIEGGLQYAALGGNLAGDMACTSTEILNELTLAASGLSASNVDLLAGRMDEPCADDAGILMAWDANGAVLQEGENFYVYGVPGYSITGEAEDSHFAMEANAFLTWANGENIDRSKVIIVLSASPLHTAEGNNGAADWVRALNQVAVGSGVSDGSLKRDIVYLDATGAAGYKAPGSAMEVTGDTMEMTLQFTYAGIGSLANNSATVLEITSDSVVFHSYTNRGKDSQITAVRSRIPQTALVPVTLEVSGKTEYAQGEAFVEPTVSVRYSDGSVKTVDNYTVDTVVDTNVPGAYTLTYSYTDGKYAAKAVLTVEVAAGMNTVSFENDYNYFTATSMGLTGMDVVDMSLECDLTEAYGDGYYVAYDITLEGYTAGEQVTYTMLVEDGMMTEGIVVYHVAADGVLTSLDYTQTTDENGWEVLRVTTDRTGIFAFGTPLVADEIPEGAELTSLTLSGPEKTQYFLSTDLESGDVYLDIAGLNVVANYTLGTETYSKTIFWNQFDELMDGYALDFGDLTVKGEKTVTVSYQGVSATFIIWVCEEDFSDDETGVDVSFTVPSVVALNITVGGPTVLQQFALGGKLSGNVQVYDITPTYAPGHTALEGTATVTLPIPEGVTNPAVYYISDDCKTLTRMESHVEGGCIVFTTDHFSSFAVGNQTIDLGAGEEESKPQDVTATETREKTVYVQVNELTSGKNYLITNLLVQNNYGSTSGQAVAHNDNNNITSANIEFVRESITVNGTPYNGYIELDDSNNVVWTATKSGDNWRFSYQTGNKTTRYLVLGNGISTSTTATGLSYSNGYLRGSRYLRYNNGWTTHRNTPTRIYFYEEVTIEEINNTTVTYSVAPMSIVEHVVLTEAVNYDNTEKLPAPSLLLNGEETTAPAGGSWSYTKVDPDDIIDSIASDGTITFNGKIGSAAVKVTYAWTEGGKPYSAYRYVGVAAVEAEFNLKITNTQYQIKNGTKDAKMTAIATLNGKTISDATIKWYSDDDSVLAVDENTGVLTPKALGSANITATWTDDLGVTHNRTMRMVVVDAVYTIDLHQPKVEYTPVVGKPTGEGPYYIKQSNGLYAEATDLTQNVTYYTRNVVTEGGNVVTVPVDSVIVRKGIETGDTDNLWAVLTEDGENVGILTSDMLAKLVFEFDETMLNVNHDTGIVTFTGKEGITTVTVKYPIAENEYISDTVTFSISKDFVFTPGDGTNDFPEYPNEGSIRFDKTATSVGAFIDTGLMNVELSMTGVPFTKDNTMDVVLMLDRSSSMYKSGVQHRITDTIAATKVFIESIVKNEDGSFNNNRIMVYDFLGGNVDSGQGGGSSHQFQANLYTNNEEDGYQIISSQAELDALFKAIDDGFKGQTSLYGTEYAQGLKRCYDALMASKEDGNQQFCVFMSDGIPNYMMGETTHFKKTSDITARFNVTNYNTANAVVTRGSNYEYELYSTLMKNAGVTVYTVGLGLKNTNSAWSNASKEACEQVANMLLNDISGPAGEKEADRDTGAAVSKLDKYFFSVADGDAAAGMSKVFGAIAKSILEAAKNVVVEDKIGGNFTMVFEPPNADVAAADDNHEYCIEVKEYSLVPEYENGIITDYNRGAVVSSKKIYMGVDGNQYFAAKDAEGKTPYEGLVFAQITEEGIRGYWTKEPKDASTWKVDGEDKSISVTVTENGQNVTYYFNIEGKGDYHITSGAYAFGTIDTETIEAGKENTDCDDLIIVTPEFVYDAETKILAWTLEKLTSNEITLSYTLYLDKSAGWENHPQKTPPGAYDTNAYADLRYDNFQGSSCEQEFPEPSVTWYGAQVSYVFYLVNEQGQPVNRAGRVVPFSEAVYVTDVHTENKIWNEKDQLDKLEATKLAAELVPDVYKLFDPGAVYMIHVYAQESDSAPNHFRIISGKSGGPYTTQVFNKKSDATRYSVPGVYGREGDVLHPEDGVTRYNAENGFDYTNTTVAFAVIWEPKLAEDTVVIDYGLDVVVDVATNDGMNGYVCSIFTGDKPVDETGNEVKMNEGAYDEPIGDDKLEFRQGDLLIARAALETGASVRFSLDKTNGMLMKEPIRFYYESMVTFMQESVEVTECMYSSVTVIPAANVYYEDEFVTLTAYDASNEVFKAGWDTKSQAATSTQASDRPGPDKISAALDADNNYGYDGAYSSMTTHSMNNSAMIHVDETKYGTAQFTFYGTGFDIISVTSNTTGTMIIQVYAGTDTEAAPVRTAIVDTYYGMLNDGTILPNDPAALYQIPVMKILDLAYGQYTVKVTATYSPFFDHTGPAGYDLYLDAIRIYDPTGVVSGASNKTVEDAYLADGEGWPVYEEVRNYLIPQSDITGDRLNGIVFIDGVDENASVADYISFGPNNEVYLAPGQAIVFTLDLPYETVASVQIGLKSATGAEVQYVICDGSTLDEKTDLTNATGAKIATATDMYYTITDLVYDTAAGASKNTPIVIYNTGDTAGSILSITNVKITFKAKTDVVDPFMVSYSVLQKILAAMNDTYVPEITPPAPGTGESGGTGAEFDPTITVTYPTGVYVGQTYEIMVKVDDPDVESVTVNGSDAIYNAVAGVWSASYAPKGTELQETIAVKVTKGEASKETTVSTNVFFDAGISVQVPKNVMAGCSYTIAVQANQDTKNVMIDGEEAVLTDGIWKATFTANESTADSAGGYSVDISAENSNGIPSETFVVKMGSVDFNVRVDMTPNTVAKNGKVTVTVTTNYLVESVKIDGRLVISHTKADPTSPTSDRIWTWTVDTANVGTKDVCISVYDVDGTEHTNNAWYKQLTVNATESTAQSITAVISKILDNLRNWFNWGN